MAEKTTTELSISFTSIFKFFVALAVLFLLYFLRDLILIIFVSLILSSILRPGIQFLKRIKIPKTISILFFYILFLSLIGLAVYLIVPVVFEQSKQLIQNISQYYANANVVIDKLYTVFNNVGQGETFTRALNAIEQQVAFAAEPVFSSIASVFGGIFSLVIMLVLTFYLLLEENALHNALMVVIPKAHQDFFDRVTTKMQEKISSWFKGQVVLSFLIGVLVYGSLSILGIKYALLLGLVAFVGEFVPYAGPFLAALPAIFIATLISPLMVIFVIILFVIIQQMENHILVPKIMQKAVGINPLISILALLIGGKVAGVLGVILAIPLATVVMVTIDEAEKNKVTL